jgi:hypothetical protein
MRTTLCFVLLCIGLASFSSCKKQKQNDSEQEVKKDTVLNYTNLPALQSLDQGALALVNGWSEYQDWERSFGIMERATTNEDLLLAIEDLIAKQDTLDLSKAPTAYDVLPIQARQKVIRTHLLQLKAALQDETQTDSSMAALYRARNSWRKQMNILLKSPLDSVMERALINPDELN